MKKKIWIPIVLVAVLAILFVPIPRGVYKDGGTREYTALTYKIIKWNRLTDDGIYKKTRVYLGEDRWQDIDQLWLEESENVEHQFRAIITNIDGSWVNVTPVSGEVEEQDSLDIKFFSDGLPDIDAKVGDTVEIKYRGNVPWTSSPQIKVFDWRKSHDLSHVEYTEEWLDKTTAKEYDYNLFSDIIITDIYSNCFFAHPVIPMPYQIKLNGTLSDEWCVGDQVICAYENIYFDEKAQRVEVDFLTVEPSDWRPDPDVCYKPVIYLYPEETTDVTVRLSLNGSLTCAYPRYNDGWRVTASPDGTLTDENGKKYNYLYWEGENYTEYDLLKGFCIKGEDTAEFLENALEDLGLTRREANEFIVYWLPLMQTNKYNLISFQTEAYTNSARLEVEPVPDTLIRVFMTYKASDEYIEIEAQELTAPRREGFTVVEWGGTELNNSFDDIHVFLKKADEIREYSKNHLESANTQYELNTESGAVLEKWETLLSEVRKYLEKELPDSEYEKLQVNELDWLAEKENAINEAAEEWKGGSGEPMARNMAAIRCIEERFTYLITLLK